MRHSVFWQLMDGEFGRTYARSLADSQVVADLGGRTPSQALAAGVEPRQVWAALCEAMQVPAERRMGREQPASSRGRRQ